MVEKTQEAVPETLKPLFADDVTSAGQAEYNAACMAYLMLEHGPPYGYSLSRTNLSTSVRERTRR